MAQGTEEVLRSVLDKIHATSLEGFSQQHMPISVYADEMDEKVGLLREDAVFFKERLNYDIEPLVSEIDSVNSMMLDQEIVWRDVESSRNYLSRFWHGNKDKLFKNNLELSERLSFYFTMNSNSEALKKVEDIGSSDVTADAIDNGCRYKNILSEYNNELSGRLYSASELTHFVNFYTTIEDAHSEAMLDRTASHKDRILRDKTYLYLRSLEKKAEKIVNAAFVHDRDQRGRYVSECVQQV